MKFARRAEGIKSGRTIFKKAREDARTRHHVYVSAALMEYYCSKVIVCCRPAASEGRLSKMPHTPVVQGRHVMGARVKSFCAGLRKYMWQACSHTSTPEAITGVKPLKAGT